jgi:hypothetical protein
MKGVSIRISNDALPSIMLTLIICASLRQILPWKN